MGNAAFDWAKSQLINEGNDTNWLNTAMGHNLIGARARNYSGQTTANPQANGMGLTSAQQEMKYGDGRGSAVTGQAWTPEPVKPMQPQPQPVIGANFGTFTADAAGALDKLGMFGQPANNNNAGNMAQFDRQMNDNRNMLAGLMTRENPFSQNNSGYLASQAQIVGQEGQSLVNALRSQRASNAQRGIRQDAGLAQNQENAMRMQTALGRNASLTGLETDRYNRAAGWDDQNRQFQAQAIQALNSGDLSRFSALTSANQQNYENARQQPFDRLKLMSGVQDFEQTGRMNPLDVLYKQGAITGQGLDNAYGSIRNQAGQLGVNYTQQTQPGAINYANATHNLGTQGANQQYRMQGDLYNDPSTYNNYLETLKTQGQRGLIQARNGVMRDAMQPGRDFEQETMGRLGNYLNIGGSVLKLAGGLGG